MPIYNRRLHCEEHIIGGVLYAVDRCTDAWRFVTHNSMDYHKHGWRTGHYYGVLVFKESYMHGYSQGLDIDYSGHHKLLALHNSGCSHGRIQRGTITAWHINGIGININIGEHKQHADI